MSTLKPWLSSKHQSIIEQILLHELKGHGVAIEFGAGGSTLHFSPMAAHWLSIEHSKAWVDKVNAHSHKANVKLVEPDFLHSGFDPAKPGQFETYREAARRLPEKSIDFALIDGRDRIGCARELCESGTLAEGAFVVLHDSNRERYKKRFHELQEWLVIDREKSCAEEKGLTVFRKVPAKAHSISIIVSAFKAHQFLEECLDSIDEQECLGEFECVVGIDGCKETLNEFNRLEGKYENVRGFFFEENRGTYVVSNTLAEFAKFDLIQRFDADDVMLPGFLQYAANSIEEGVEYYRFRHLKFRDEGGERRVRFYDRPSEGQSLFSRSLFTKLGAWKAWQCGADTDLMNRAFASGEGHKLNGIAAFLKREHGASLTGHPSTGHGSSVRNEYEKQLREGHFERVERIVNRKFHEL